MKQFTIIILLSSVLISGCSYMPKWINDLNPWGDENEEVETEVTK